MLDRAAEFRHRVRISRDLLPARQRRAKLPRKIPPKTIALSYYRAIKPILDRARAMLERVLAPHLPELARQAAAARRHDVSGNSACPLLADEPPERKSSGQRTDAVDLNAIIDAVGKEFFDSLRPTEISVLAEKFARATAEYEKQQAMKQVRAAFGVDVMAREPQLAAKEHAFVSENVALIKSIPSQFFDDVEKRVAGAIARGATAEDLAAEIAERYKVADDRAMLISRDQTSKYFGNVAQARQQSMGVEHYFWRTSNDERVREEHAALEGERFSWDDPPAPGHPGEDFQCFPGDTVLTPSSGVQKLYRRWVTDDLTTLVASNGVALRATSNHPILTRTGWKAAKDIDVGEDIVEATSQILQVLGVDLQGAQSVFVETFRAADRLFGMREANVLRGGFHGDAAFNEKVDVVDVDWGLGIELDPALTESICYDALVLADDPAARLGALAQMFDALLLATHRGVRGGCKLLARILAEEGVAHEHSLAATAWCDAAADKLAADGRARDAKLLRQLFDRAPLGVERHGFIARVVSGVMGRVVASADRDAARAQVLAEVVRVDQEQAGDFREGLPVGQKFLRVVQKSVSEFSDHVYNMQTKSSRYIAQGFVVHNCRCYAEPDLSALLDGDEPHAQALAEEEGG